MTTVYAFIEAAKSEYSQVKSKKLIIGWDYGYYKDIFWIAVHVYIINKNGEELLFDEEEEHLLPWEKGAPILVSNVL